MEAAARHPSTPDSNPGQRTWWIDGHLDLAYRHLHGRSVALPAMDSAVCGLSLPALREGNVRVMLATIFTELGADADPRWGYAGHGDAQGAHAAGVRQLQTYRELEQAGELTIIRTRKELEACARGTKPVGAVILMEGADPIREPLEAAWWHAQGVRAVGLAWARGSRYAGGNSTGGGLTSAGRELVRQLDALGVLHDASHLSDQAFADVLAATERSVVATHSNSRALMDSNQRHLTDAQIRCIAERDGVIGLNLFSKFLAVGRPATMDDAVAHIEHAASIAGRERVCVGSDFDGGFTPAECPAGCQRPQELGALTAGLAARGWTDAECAGFAHGNWMRFLRRALPPS